MSTFLHTRALVASLSLLTALLVPAAAHAGKPDWVEDGHPGKQGKDKKHQKGPDDDGARDRQTVVVRPASPSVSVQIQIGGYFNDYQRHDARAYYEPRWRAGHCPPGLAKKGNGCQPPGQAKKWHRGQPLPRDVIYYPVPASVQVKLGTPPAGHKFVRVATDLLLIAVGTGMVIDAIEDLGQL